MIKRMRSMTPNPMWMTWRRVPPPRGVVLRSQGEGESHSRPPQQTYKRAAGRRIGVGLRWWRLLVTFLCIFFIYLFFLCRMQLTKYWIILDGTWICFVFILLFAYIFCVCFVFFYAGIVNVDSKTSK